MTQKREQQEQLLSVLQTINTHLNDLGGAPLVWIFGHSFVYWGALRADVRRNGRVVVRHRDLESGEGNFWRSDGVHLTAVGIDLWALSIQEGVERALILVG
ncbi:uncharacterized protein ACNLHF_021249 [Anomaloglossus baeobatrachus]